MMYHKVSMLRRPDGYSDEVGAMHPPASNLTGASGARRPAIDKIGNRAPDSYQYLSEGRPYRLRLFPISSYIK